MSAGKTEAKRKRDTMSIEDCASNLVHELEVQKEGEQKILDIESVRRYVDVESEQAAIISCQRITTYRDVYRGFSDTLSSGLAHRQTLNKLDEIVRAAVHPVVPCHTFLAFGDVF